MRTIAVIGKNFGDEGKGLAVDHLSLHSKRALVVRHNGGAQSGHTVERRMPKGTRFVFHELSSGSFCHADTLWTSGYYPDVLKLREEIGEFHNAFGFIPKIFAMDETCITVPDDVLINMALETSRGDNRHGSCGMGINECDIRTKLGYGLRIGDICSLTADELFRELFKLRCEYTCKRLGDINNSLNDNAKEYLSLLSNSNVLRNAAMAMADSLRYVKVLTFHEIEDMLGDIETLIFESGQGLLLDKDNEKYAPHLTSSNTGLVSIQGFLNLIGQPLDEAVYVSRSYVTRHGAGRLDCECSPEKIGKILKDRTNETNEWQGRIRYARHKSVSAFVEEVRKDLDRSGINNCKVSLFLTHLNETENKIAMKDGDISVNQFIGLPCIAETFDGFYISDTPYTEDVKGV